MLDTMVTTYIEHYHLLPQQGKVIVAVSGGADSLCLLHLLHLSCGVGKRYPGVNLHVAHLNHQLRGAASEQDAVVIEALARSWQLPVTIGASDVSALARAEQLSLEEAARIARYRFLRAVAMGQPIAVAHHKDDQVETLLLHWLRGGGLASMSGLQPRQQDIIRPLLAVTHADTLAYCEQHQLTPLEDASNNDPRFLRNRVRHELLPLLTSMNAGIRETLLRNAEVMQVDFSWLETQVDTYWSTVVAVELAERIQLRLAPLKALPLSLQRHLIRRVTARLHDGQSPLELRHYRLLEQLMQRECARETVTLHLPQQLHVMRTAETLIFARVHTQGAAASGLAESAEVLLPLPGRVAVPGTGWTALADIVPDPLLQRVRLALHSNDWAEVWRVLPAVSNAVYVDVDRLQRFSARADQEVREDLYSCGEYALRVRTRRAGDRIQPLGMAHEKKVQDVLVDKHVPRSEREQIPLFFTETHCIWLAGIQLAEQARLSNETQNIVRLSIIQTEE